MKKRLLRATLLLFMLGWNGTQAQRVGFGLGGGITASQRSPGDVAPASENIRWGFNTQGAILYVNDDAVGTNNGTSWADAYTDLKTALGAAGAGTEIWVAAGTYKPAGVNGNPSSTFLINKNLRLLGGFAGTETSADQRDHKANATILSGDLNENDVDDNFTPAYRADNVSRVVSIAANVTSANNVIDGFIIEGGHADGAFIHGGGILSSGKPIIKQCLFRQNYAVREGGAFRQNATTGAGGFTLLDCRFEKNTANAGGAVSALNTSFLIQGCDFVGNSVFDSLLEANGGGVYLTNSTGEVNNCLFKDNSASEYGGGLVFFSPLGTSGANGTVSNCRFENNEANIYGGGLFFVTNGNNANFSVDSCYFTQNSAPGGTGLYAVMRGKETIFRLQHSTFIENHTNANTNSDSTSFATAAIYSSDAATGTVVVDNCLFKNNVAVSTGGMDIGSGSIGDDMDFTISNCAFLNNTAVNYCGGLDLFAAVGTSPTFLVENCLVEGNSAGKRNGGVWMDVTSSSFQAAFRNCRILDNQSPEGGAVDFFLLEIGALALPTGAQLTLENCLIANNTCGNGAITVDSFPNVKLINCTIVGNQGGLRLSDSSGVTLQNTILHNPGFREYQALTGDATFTSRGGNLIGDGSLGGKLLPTDKQNLDPLFVNVGDYHLTAESPCVDAGNNDGVTATVDLDGKSRIHGSRVDMGAYESEFTSASKEVWASEVAVWPNPASGHLNIHLPKSVAGLPDVLIFDTQGRLVRQQRLANGQTLDVQGLSPSMYALKVVVGERVYAGKFVKR